MGAGGHFWKARVIDFIALSANAHNQEKQKDWKYKGTSFFFFFLTVHEKIASWNKCISKQCIVFL